MPLGEDGVIAVFAIQGEAFLAALEQTMDVLITEVPAAVALAEVAAQRAHVTDLRPADGPRRRGQRWKQFPEYATGLGNVC